MSARLFIHNAADDHIAQALKNINAGEEVLVITDNGVKFAEITAQVHIPRHYHVSIKNLTHNEIIKKAGCEIGQICAQIYNPAEENELITWEIPAGYPIHLGNFIPSINLWAVWGNEISAALNTTVEFTNPPYSIAEVKRAIEPGDKIRLDDLKIPDTLKERLFRNLDDKKDFIVGKAIDKLPEEAVLRLGFCIEKPPFFKPNERNMKSIDEWINLLEGRF